MSLVDALKSGKNVQYTGNSSSNVNIKVGDGNSNITVRGSNVDITAGTGNQNVVVLGNDVDIKLDQGATADFDIDKDFDNVAVISDKGDVNIDTGSGNDRVVAVADNVNINMGDGTHMIDFWGDNVNINVGDGDNQIFTMDKSITAGTISENTTWLGVNIGQAAVDAVEADTVEYTETLKDITNRTGTNKEDFMKEMKDTYNLDKANMEMLEKLYDSGELFNTFTSGGKTYPRYSIMDSVTQKNSDGSPKKILCYNDYTVGSEGMHTRGLIQTNSSNYGSLINVDGKTYGFKECVATKDVDVNSYKEQATYTHVVETRDVYRIDGTKNLTIKTGNGDYSNINVTSTGVVDIKTGNILDNLINIDAEVKVLGDIDRVETVYTEPERTIMWGSNHAKTYTSPIVVDFNKDGKVDAASGNGVDVNGDGIGDGYATNGDKMLAMSDTNGNGTIDGSEVFGDQTVSPFTGEKYNAANGFEALKMVAQEAEKFTGIKCLTGSFVNLQTLKDALATVGINLGFIGDNNITELEDLAHVAALNVDNYNEVAAEGDVQHRQLGTYTDADGNEYAADDVWFRNRTMFEKMQDRMS